MQIIAGPFLAEDEVVGAGGAARGRAARSPPLLPDLGAELGTAGGVGEPVRLQHDARPAARAASRRARPVRRGRRGRADAPRRAARAPRAVRVLEAARLDGAGLAAEIRSCSRSGRPRSRSTSTARERRLTVALQAPLRRRRRNLTAGPGGCVVRSWLRPAARDARRRAGTRDGLLPRRRRGLGATTASWRCSTCSPSTRPRSTSPRSRST